MWLRKYSYGFRLTLWNCRLSVYLGPTNRLGEAESKTNDLFVLGRDAFPSSEGIPVLWPPCQRHVCAFPFDLNEMFLFHGLCQQILCAPLVVDCHQPHLLHALSCKTDAVLGTFLLSLQSHCPHSLTCSTAGRLIFGDDINSLSCSLVISWIWSMWRHPSSWVLS